MAIVKTLQAISLLSFIAIIPCFLSLPLSTYKGYLIDDETGHRVKLVCASWPTHLKPLLAEGLAERPLSKIVAEVPKNGYNCIRLTYATFMFTRPDYGNLTVAQTFDFLNLTQAKAGIQKNNPDILEMNHIQAFEAVIDELGNQDIMVVLDNHISKPAWCCGQNDGNGFFGDTYFDFDEWLEGITMVTRISKKRPQVVGLSMRNEPPGPKQSAQGWYNYMGKGAAAVHRINPDVLVIISGIDYASNLYFLRKKPLQVNLGKKLVYEAHWYSFSWGQEKVYLNQPLNKACVEKRDFFINRTAFMNTGKNPIPLFLSEAGIDQRGLNVAQDRFMSCYLSYVLDQDLDWGLWSLQGNYYLRQNRTGMEETFGVLDLHWTHTRNPQYENRLKLIKRVNQDPTSAFGTSNIMFHPQSGTCMQAQDTGDIYAVDCDKRVSRWFHDGDGAPIRLRNTDLCLKALGDGASPILTTDCSSKQSKWKKLSETKLYLATTDEKGKQLCLHKESPQTAKILTTKCMCIEDEPECHTNPQKDPTIQWFKLVKTNV